MYKVYCDNELLYSDRLESYMIYEPKLSLEINKAGTFDFTIYPNHPRFDDLKKMRSIITVYNDENLLFRGRILNMETGWLNQKDISCEGDLAFLNDSIVLDSYEWDADTTAKTIKEAMEFYLQCHNEQMRMIDGVDEDDYIVTFKTFKLRLIGWTDDKIVRINSDGYESTWDSVERLVKEYGGYIYTTYEEDGAYLNYSKDYSTIVLNQPIEFGKNILDFTHSANGEDIFTGIVPLGGMSSVEDAGRITINIKNNNVPYLLDNEAAKNFGVILKKIEFNDVVDKGEDYPDYCPEDILLEKGKEHMKNAGLLAEEIEIKAVDLSILNRNFDSFRIGTNVSIFDPNHGVYEVKDGVKSPRSYQVTKLDIELLSPDKNKITIGSTGQSLTEQSAKTIISQNVSIDNVNKKIDSMELNLKPISESAIRGIIG